MISLKDLVPAAQNSVNAQFIVLEKGETTIERQNKACLSMVADETAAAVHFQLRGDECELVEPGDIIHLTNGIFSYSRNNLVLRAGKRGKIVKVGEFNMVFVETPNMSEIHWVPDATDSKKYVKESILSPYSRPQGYRCTTYRTDLVRVRSLFLISFHQTIDMATARKHFLRPI